jgi:hypothetical protein
MQHFRYFFIRRTGAGLVRPGTGMAGPEDWENWNAKFPDDLCSAAQS